jgi:hypothetical protein
MHRCGILFTCLQAQTANTKATRRLLLGPLPQQRRVPFPTLGLPDLSLILNLVERLRVGSDSGLNVTDTETEGDLRSIF